MPGMTAQTEYQDEQDEKASEAPAAPSADRMVSMAGFSRPRMKRSHRLYLP